VRTAGSLITVGGMGGARCKMGNVWLLPMRIVAGARVAALVTAAPIE
jgi:hypothetical protein